MGMAWRSAGHEPGTAGECSDVDEDGCDDCASGFFDPSDDGLDVGTGVRPCFQSTCQDAGFVCVPDSVRETSVLGASIRLHLNWANPLDQEECIEGQYCDEVCLDLGSGL